MLFLKMFVGLMILLMFVGLVASKNKTIDKIVGYVGVGIFGGIVIGIIGLVCWGLGTMFLDVLHGLGVLK